MADLVIELTNRCNLACQHCFSGRHGGRDDLSLAILHKVLSEAKVFGFDRVSFTGGDPTVYRHFADAMRLACQEGYRFGFNTNGWNFTTTYQAVLPYRDHLSIITFSLDGATEDTHDRLRGRGSFRRVMQAVSICVIEDLPFSLNMVIAAHNRRQVGSMVQLAAQLGSRGLRFGHLMPSMLATLQELDLSPEERKAVEAEIWILRKDAAVPVAIAPGYHTPDIFPCHPLQLMEVNVDCHGRLTTCCHLSGHGDGAGDGDIIGDLGQMSFDQAYRRLVDENDQFRQEKRKRLVNGALANSDFFPCWYCSHYYRKIEWLRNVDGHPWADLVPARPQAALA